MSEIRGRRSEVGGQKTEDRGLGFLTLCSMLHALCQGSLAPYAGINDKGEMNG